MHHHSARPFQSRPTPTYHEPTHTHLRPTQDLPQTHPRQTPGLPETKRRPSVGPIQAIPGPPHPQFKPISCPPNTHPMSYPGSPRPSQAFPRPSSKPYFSPTPGHLKHFWTPPPLPPLPQAPLKACPRRTLRTSSLACGEPSLSICSSMPSSWGYSM